MEGSSECSFSSFEGKKEVIPHQEPVKTPGISAVVFGYHVTISWFSTGANMGDKLHVIVEGSTNELTCPPLKIVSIVNGAQGSFTMDNVPWGTYRVILLTPSGQKRPVREAVFRVGPDPKDKFKVVSEDGGPFVGGSPLYVTVPVECIFPDALVYFFSCETGKSEGVVPLKEGVFYADTNELIIQYPTPRRVGKHICCLFLDNKTLANSGTATFNVVNEDKIWKEMIHPQSICRIHWAAKSFIPTDESILFHLLPSFLYVYIFDSDRSDAKCLWWDKVPFSESHDNGCVDIPFDKLPDLADFAMTGTPNERVKRWELRLNIPPKTLAWGYGKTMAKSRFLSVQDLGSTVGLSSSFLPK